MNSITNSYRQQSLSFYRLSTLALGGLAVAVKRVAEAIFLAYPLVNAKVVFTAAIFTAATVAFTLFVRNRLCATCKASLEPAYSAETSARGSEVFKGAIAINFRECGRFGEESARQLVPYYFTDLMDANRAPFSIGEEDLIIECSLRECTLDGLSAIYLPLKIFSDKEFGGKIAFFYKEELFTLKIEAQDGQRGSINDVLAPLLSQKRLPPLFKIFNPNAWFTWKPQDIYYRLVNCTEEGRFCIKQEQIASAPKPKQPCESLFNFCSLTGRLKVYAEFPGFKLTDLHVVLKKTKLVVYAERSRFDSLQGSTLSTQDQAEVAFRLDFKKCFHYPFVEMKSALECAQFTLRDGILEMFFEALKVH